jgi:hypothetical protein
MRAHAYYSGRPTISSFYFCVFNLLIFLFVKCAAYFIRSVIYTYWYWYIHILAMSVLEPCMSVRPFQGLQSNILNHIYTL